MSEHLTDATESGSSLPTPTADDANNATRASGSMNSLTRSVMWPTPIASEAQVEQPLHKWKLRQEGKAQQGINLQKPLSVAVQMFPTPRAGKTTDETEESWARRHAAGKVATPPLALAVRMIPTPTCGDAKSSGSRNTANSAAHAGISLTDYVREDGGTGRIWPTPTCQDANNNGSPSQQNRNQRALNTEVATPDPAMRLSAEWVEELMGWPRGWTALPPDSGTATGKRRRE
jgi:hypothetical protein